MVTSANQIDRLLPRHESVINLDLTWDVRMNRNLWKKEEVSAPATIRDISLEGALVQVESTHEHAVGDRITVRFRGHEGTAVVRHCREGEDNTLLYGVRFVPDPAFVDCLCDAVGEIRGHSAELRRAWQRPN
ncbi:MAG: PilZ domain-containing protein [Acidimicrobiales bacterium]